MKVALFLLLSGLAAVAEGVTYKNTVSVCPKGAKFCCPSALRGAWLRSAQLRTEQGGFWAAAFFPLLIHRAPRLSSPARTDAPRRRQTTSTTAR